MGIQHVAQICLNGHLINSTYDNNPSSDNLYCSKCGQKTIIACPNCNAPLRGYYEVDDFLILSETTTVESYCHKCGKPYPWIEKALTNARLIVLEESSIPNEQKDALISSLPDIITESPGTTLATTRMKKFLSSAGEFTCDALKQFVIEFGCELAKSLSGFQ